MFKAKEKIMIIIYYHGFSDGNLFPDNTYIKKKEIKYRCNAQNSTSLIKSHNCYTIIHLLKTGVNANTGINEQCSIQGNKAKIKITKKRY